MTPNNENTVTSEPRENNLLETKNSPYSWYVVFVLMLCYALSFIDRQILSLLVQPIKRDLDLSDIEFGLLQGMAFAIFYTFVGLYMGKLADTRNRRTLIAAGIAAWSVMTALCGLSKNFLQLFLARIGVAVGESALSPAAYSIIGDYFHPSKLGRAMSAYTVGVYLGSGLAFIVGGALIGMIPDQVSLPLVGTLSAWQVVFIIVGLPGLLFALLVLTIKEPVRGRFASKKVSADGASNSGDQSIFDALHYFIRSWRFYLMHFLGFSLLTTVGYAFHSWVPAYFIRVLGWDASEVGLVYGTISIVCAPAGVLCGGWFGDYLLKRGSKDAYVRAPIIGALFVLIPAAFATTPFSPNVTTTLVLLAILQFFASFHGGMAIASLHSVTPLRMRAQATALYLFTINLVGLGLGPVLVAVVTDIVYENEAMVGNSLAITGGIAALLSIVFLLFARKSYALILSEKRDD
mgnify:FL=1